MKDETQATALIESGAPLREIAKRFTTRLDAYRYYAEKIQSRYTPAMAVRESECASCKCATGSERRQIAWRATTHDKGTATTALILLLLGRLTSRRIEVQFKTAHGYCTACARRLWWSLSLLRSAKSALFAILLVTLIATVPVVVLTVAVAFSARDLLPTMSIWLAIGGGLTFLLYCGFKWLWTSAVPKHLQFIARFPFEPLSIRKFDQDTAHQ